jgi:hypothetical protein
MEPGMLRDYEQYVVAAEQRMTARFEAGSPSWVPAAYSTEAGAKLASGHSFKSNISDQEFNSRIATRNGTVIHWIGAIHIPGARLEDLASVLADYDQFTRVYRPMIYECHTVLRASDPAGFDEIVLGLRSTFRFASVFPQHYAFRAQARIRRSDLIFRGTRALRIHLTAGEIRESDSGVPGRDDFLEPYRDHGIMWALNSYWHGREEMSGVYLEFETITLARSVQAFSCKIGFLAVPRSAVSTAMDVLPAESITTILEGTKAECARRTAGRLFR